MMFKKTITTSAILLLTACSTTMPSFYDDNESLKAADLVHSVNSLNCYAGDIVEQVDEIGYAFGSLKTYSELKGSEDILSLINKMEPTITQFDEKETIVAPFCNIKKRILYIQTEKLAKTIMGRY